MVSFTNNVLLKTMLCKCSLFWTQALRGLVLRCVHTRRELSFRHEWFKCCQCKDSIDNPAALFLRMARIVRITWHEFSIWRTIRTNSTSWKIWILADIRTALTNQELALAVTSLKSETTMEDKVIVVVCGYPELYIHLRTFTKTGIHCVTRLELPGRSPSH